MRGVTQPKTVVGGRYEVVRKIAEGGMGSVHEAVHLLSRRTVALKLLAPEVARDEVKRQRFLREVSAPAQIGHDGIVEVFDAGYDEKLGVLFVAMELLQGETLRDRIARLDPKRSPENREILLDLFDRMLEPIAAAHARGIVHRDLKPENVFVHRRRDGVEVVKVLDFGIARELDTSRPSVTQTGIAMGTPHYMSPEQAMSARDASFPADVWSLGAMLFEVLTGSTPFPGDTAGSIIAAVVTEAHPPVGAMAPGTSPMLIHLVDRCLAKRPEDRPADAGALLEELRRARGRAAPPLGVASTSSPTPAPSVASPVPTGNAARTGPLGGQGPAGNAPTMTPDQLPALTAPMAGIAATTARPVATSGPAHAPFATPAPASSASPPAAATAAPAPGPASMTWVWIVAGVFVVLFGGGVCCVGSVVGLGFLGAPEASSASLADGPITWSDELSASDRSDDRGSYYDTYSFTVGAGERVSIELSSAAFDTVLRVRTPSGGVLEHDDIQFPVNTNSRVDIPFSEAGEYTVHVTSFQRQVTGAYTASVHH
jgi:serine/threonine-protein kinase